MKTHLLYLENSYQKEMEAEVLSVFPEKENRWQVILDRTVFYPMGGGQPTDQGVLFGKDWEAKVYQVLQKGEEVVHFIQAEQPPAVGMRLNGLLDWERRYFNMRLHSAGHVMDFALYLLGYSPGMLAPLKGDHGKKPSILYAGEVAKDFKEELEKKSLQLIAQDLVFSTSFVGYEELERSCLYVQPGLPKDQPLRMLTLEGVGCVPDGGTQVHKTSEIGALSVLSIECSGQNTKICYRIA